MLVCLAIPHTRVQLEGQTNIAEFVSMPAFDVVRVAVLAAGVLDALQGVDTEFGKRGGPWSQGIWEEAGEFCAMNSRNTQLRCTKIAPATAQSSKNTNRRRLYKWLVG